MRIFKNRGDIFFSKTDKERSTEHKILIALLTLTVAFTLVFVVLVGAKYDFSAKEFFKPEGLKTTVAENDEDDYQIPDISGKYNFAVFVNGENELLFSYILQTDMDSVAYKLSAVKADTVYQDSRLDDIYKSSPEAAVKLLEAMLDTKLDYFVSISSEAYCSLFDDMGSVNYPVISDIRYKNNKLSTPLNFRVKAGEQSLKGTQVINLVRYYLDVESNASIANDLLLACFSQQFNEENYADREALFQKLITSCDSNITVREFSKADEMLGVLSDGRAGVKVYNAPLEYENGKPTEKSLNTVKGYFSK